MISSKRPLSVSYKRYFFAFCWVATPLLAATNQACMKLLAARTEILPLREALLSPYPFSILCCEIISLYLWLRILAVMPVSRAVPLMSVTYILVLLVGWLGFHEPISPLQILGSVLIMSGLYLLSTGHRASGDTASITGD